MVVGGVEVAAGTREQIHLPVARYLTGEWMNLPVEVIHGSRPGPAIWMSGAIHGDELDGVEITRGVSESLSPARLSGTVFAIPIVNVFGFLHGSRYLPDRRDLNRSFPGSETGSLTSRLAHLLTKEILSRSDFGIDLHTAAVRRTNYPNVRADMSNPGCARLAKAFGCGIIVDQAGPEGSLRNCATGENCPTIILEAGEVWKVEPMYLETALRGISNVLADLGMIEEETAPAQEPYIVTSTSWVRADSGGFLQFHVSPGDVVEKDQILATNYGLLGREQEVVQAAVSGIVIGMSTMPAVAPGDPIIHLARLKKKEFREYEKEAENGEAYVVSTREDLATNVHVVEAPEETD